MSYSTFNNRFFQLTTLSFALALAGCGGEGFRDLGPKPELGSVDNGSNANGNVGGNNTNSLGTVDSTVKNLVVTGQLIDKQKKPIKNIDINGAEYRVTVLDDKGQPIVGAIVNFSMSAQGVSFTETTSGSFLTDDNGTASVFLKPDNIEVSGAYIISANVSFEGGTQSVEQSFSVQSEDAILSDIKLEKSALLSGEDTNIELEVLNKQGMIAPGIIVDLSASCGSIPNQVTSNYKGVVSAVYKSIDSNGKPCSGEVSISARKGSESKDAVVTIAQPVPTTILYTTQNLQVLGLSDSGATGTSQVEFTVYNNKQPLPNQKVILSLRQTPAGFTFGQQGNIDPILLTSDEEGKVYVNLYPGSTPGPIEIKATIDSNGDGQENANETIFALSKNLSVGGGRTTQSGISVGFEKNVLDWSVNGNSTTVTARLRDRNANPVPKGTVVSFTAEGGRIEPSCQTDKDGNCSVNFVTVSGPRNDHRVSILAVVEGEKDFIDENQNNSWDEGEPFVYNIGDTFRDDNENGILDNGEFIYPIRTKGRQACEDNMSQKYSNKDTRVLYKMNWVMPNIDDTCTDKLTAPVRAQIITLLSNSIKPLVIIGKKLDDNSIEPAVITYNTSDPQKKAKVVVANSYALGVDFSGTQNILESDGDKDIYFLVNSSQYPLNPLPSGTVFTSEVEDKTPDNKKECSVEISGDERVPNIVSGNKEDNLGTVTRVSLTGCAAGDTIKFTTSTPNGTDTRFTYKIRK